MSNILNILSSIINEEITVQHLDTKKMDYILNTSIYNISHIEDQLKKHNIKYSKNTINKDTIKLEMHPMDMIKVWKVLFLDKNSINNRIYDELEK